MSVTIKLDLRAVDGAVNAPAEVTDSSGRRWRLQLPDLGAVFPLTLIQVPKWVISIGGTKIGEADGDDPAEAMRDAFSKSGLTSLPEAVAVQVFNEHESWMVFTLGGQAFKVTNEQFVKEVMGSTRWVQGQQAKRHEIDALMKELRG